MNLLCVTGNLSHADYLEHELAKIAPHIHMDVSPGNDDALARMSVSGRYDVVLLDAVVNGADSQSLITRIRQMELPLAVVVMPGPSGEDPPLKLLDAGADDYVVKKPNFVKSLPALLQRVIHRRHRSLEIAPQSIELMHTGDIQRVRRCFSHPGLVKLHSTTADPEGSCIIPGGAPGRLPYDAVVLDDSVHGVRILRALKEILAVAPEMPIFLLISPGQEPLATHGRRMGATECIIKNGDYSHHLASSIESAICRRNLMREKAAIRSTESRLRLIIETIPTCVVRLSPHGTFQAINLTGLAMVGADRLDQIVGKNFPAMAGPQNEERLRDYISRVSSGECSSIQFDWEGLDGVVRTLEMRAVPLGREIESRRAILAVLHGVEKQAGVQTESETADAERASLENCRRELQNQRTEIESSRSEMAQTQVTQQQALHALEAQCAGLQSQFEFGRTEVDRQRQELDRQQAGHLAAIGEMEADQAAQTAVLQSQHLAELESWENARCELQRQCQMLAETARHAEAGKSELEEQYRLARLEWDKACQTLKCQYNDAEAKRAEAEGQNQLLAKTGREMETRCAAIEARQRSEQTDWEARRRQLELQRAALQETIDDLQNRLAAMEQNHDAERAEWEKLLQQSEVESADAAPIESRREVVEEALQAIETRCTALGEQYRSELAQWDKARAELKSRREQSERRRAVLEEAMHTLEDRLSEIQEQHRTEKAEWDRACHDTKQAYIQEKAEADKRSTAMKQALLSVEARCGELEAQCRAVKTENAEKVRELQQLQMETAAKKETLDKTLASLERYQQEVIGKQQLARADWDNLRQELERQRAARAALEEALRISEARCAEVQEQQEAELLAAREELERQSAGRLKLEEDLRSLELQTTQLREDSRKERMKPRYEPAPAVIQALNELIARLRDCVELLSQCLPHEDPCRTRSTHLLELAVEAGELALRLLALKSSSPDQPDNR